MKCDLCKKEMAEGENYTFFYENQDKVENRTHWICKNCVFKSGYRVFFTCLLISIPWFILNYWLWNGGVLKYYIINISLFNRLIMLIYLASVVGSIIVFLAGFFMIGGQQGGIFAATDVDKEFLNSNNFIGKSKSDLLSDLKKRCEDDFIHNRHKKLLDSANKILMIEPNDDFAIKMRDHAFYHIK
jgi:hypothetical protein